MIDRYHLRYFLSVVDTGNFSRGAAACNVSQPTLSVGIAKMEAALGRPLFHRTNRRVELTDAGVRLLGHARMIEAEFAAAEREVIGTVDGGTLRLGILSTTPRRWTEHLLHERRAFPTGDRIEIVEGTERDLRHRLARGRIDAAVTIVRDDDGDRGRPILIEGYSLALGTVHPLATRASIRVDELANDPMILRRHCELLAETSRFFTARGIRPFFPARTTGDDKALGYVRAGLGVTVMPDGFRDPGVVRIPLDGFDFTRTIGLVHAAHVDAQSASHRQIAAALAAAATDDR
ncbi:LysR family transcriptional regulator [Sphingomonas sp. CFBP 8760]|uniref:LysR family transcriptional regulator n=1 Tax=Sphingomonas sp. CFBP 8760 TaxID=2775282 RepID=UPI0017803667|nr:LysR family transcriptional regulator [Sphingomonas sp. CFBP 8760]MBD8547729.1 LysR family transcriptional regulator [Sphingomonas sp. CFBP 8760]